MYRPGTLLADDTPSARLTVTRVMTASSGVVTALAEHC